MIWLTSRFKPYQEINDNEIFLKQFFKSVLGRREAFSDFGDGKFQSETNSGLIEHLIA